MKEGEEERNSLEAKRVVNQKKHFSRFRQSGKKRYFELFFIEGGKCKGGGERRRRDLVKCIQGERLRQSPVKRIRFQSF